MEYELALHKKISSYFDLPKNRKVKVNPIYTCEVCGARLSYVGNKHLHRNECIAYLKNELNRLYLEVQALKDHVYNKGDSNDNRW